MAVVSSCGGTARGRSSPLSADLQRAGKKRNLTLEHAHRTASAVAQICLKPGFQSSSSLQETKEFQDQLDSGHSLPPVNQGLSSHSLSHASTFHQTTGSRLGPSGAELYGEGETEQVPVHKSHQRGTHLGRFSETLSFSEVAHHIASAGTAADCAGTAADCRAGELTQPLQPILPQAQITKVPHGTTATLAKLGAKTYTQAEGSKLCNYLSGIKGLACPYGSPKCQEEKLNSRQECGKLLQWRRSAPAGTSTICTQLKPYHSVNSGSNLKTAKTRSSTKAGVRLDFSPNDWVAPQLGLPEQSSTGRVKLNRCLYIKATREKLTWGDSVRHYASEE